MGEKWKIPLVFIFIDKMMCLVPLGGKGMERRVILNPAASKTAQPSHKNICQQRPKVAERGRPSKREAAQVSLLEICDPFY